MYIYSNMYIYTYIICIYLRTICMLLVAHHLLHSLFLVGQYKCFLSTPWCFLRDHPIIHPIQSMQSIPSHFPSIIGRLVEAAPPLFPHPQIKSCKIIEENRFTKTNSPKTRKRNPFCISLGWHIYLLNSKQEENALSLYLKDS